MLGGHSTVAQDALDYLSIRAWACPGALLMLAATGACRGNKDPSTPLQGAAAQYATNFALDLALIFGLGMGVQGAAAAATIGQYVGVAVVLKGLTGRGDLRREHVAQVPAVDDVCPYARVRERLLCCCLYACDTRHRRACCCRAATSAAVPSQ